MKRHPYSLKIAHTYQRLFKWTNNKRQNKIRHKWLSHLKYTILNNSAQLEYNTILNIIHPINEELLILEQKIEINTDLVAHYRTSAEYRALIG